MDSRFMSLLLIFDFAVVIVAIIVVTVIAAE